MSSEPRVLSVSWRAARISGAVRVSVATTGAAASATTGTVTSAVAGALRVLGAALSATTSVLETVLGATVFLSAAGILFEITADFTAGISNAVGILSCRLTCLNHNPFQTNQNRVL